MECNNILFIFIVFSQLCTLLAIFLNFKNTKMKRNIKKIIDNTMEDDHDFMVERINILTEQLSWEKLEHEAFESKYLLAENHITELNETIRHLRKTLKTVLNQDNIHNENDKKV